MVSLLVVVTVGSRLFREVWFGCLRRWCSPEPCLLAMARASWPELEPLGELRCLRKRATQTWWPECDRRLWELRTLRSEML